MVKLYNSIINPCFYCFLILYFLCSGTSLAQVTVNPNFNNTDRGFGFGDGFNGAVTAVKVQPDGRVLVGGQFTRYNGAPRFGLARLKGNNQGLDSTFGTFSNFGVSGGVISQFAIQPDGKIIAVGSFTQFGPSTVNRIVRLNSDGSQDFGFLTGSGADGPIYGAEVLPDGKIIVAGNFNSFNSANRSSVVRLMPNGTVDLSFNAGTGGPGTGQGVRGLKIQSDDKILICGDFVQQFNGIPLVPSGESHFVIRLLANGQLDPSFNIPYGGSGIVNSLDVNASGQMVIGGNFENINGINRINLARLLPGGEPDPAFISPFSAGNGPVINLILLPGGNTIFSGIFSQVGNVFRGRIARISGNGSLDPAFAGDSASDGPILAMDQDGLGRVVVGGFFRRIDETQRRNIGRLSSVGLVELPFSQNTGADDIVYAMAMQPNGRLIIGGDFGYFNWNKRNGVVKLLPNGQNDPGFTPGKGANGAVRTILIQPDKKILVGGRFNSFNNANRRGLVRLDSTGLVDPAFSIGLGANDTIWALARFSNGKILAGGDFTLFNGQNAKGIVRLNPNGTIDNSFQSGSGFNGRVRTIKIYQDSIVYVGGDFNAYNGFSRNGIVRLDANGNFRPINNQGPGISADGKVHAIAFQPNGLVLVGGQFTQYNGVNRLNLIRMTPTGSIDPAFDASAAADGPVKDMFVNQTNGKITAGGDFEDGNKGIGRNGIIRLKPNGARDLSFSTGTGTNDPVNAVLENGNEILIAGEFTGFDGTGRNRIASLLDEPLDFTVWDGNSWDSGPPGPTIHAFIEGLYNGPGFSCKNLTVISGGSLSLTSETEVFGDGANQSSSPVRGTIIMKGSSPQTWKGAIENLTIDNANGATLSGVTPLIGTLKLQNGPFNSDGKLILVSNSSGTARLAKVEPSAALLGEVTVQRFVPGSAPGWFLIGTPVENQSTSDWSDDFTITDNTFFLHNEGGTLNNGLQVNGWEFSPPNISVGRGYRAFLNQSFFGNGATFSNKGQIITGPKSFNVSFTPIGFGGGGWNLLANPYPCEIDFQALSRTNIGGQMHIWNHDVQAYATYSIGTGISIFGADQYIASSQGFFVKAFASSPSLQITEDAKPITPANNSFLRMLTQDPPDVGRFKLKNSNGENDEVGIRWMAQAGPQFEEEFDADKFGNGPFGISLFSKTQEGRRAAIQGRSFEDADSVYFGYSVENPGSYFFEINLGEEIYNGKIWVLKDLESGFSYPIGNNQFVFPFEIPSFSLFASNRFLLVGKLPVGNLKILENPPLIFPNPGQNKLLIKGLKGNEEIEIQDAKGKTVFTEKSSGRETMEILTDQWISGIYFIATQSEKNKQVVKWVKH